MRGDEIVIQAEIGKAHDLALVHRQAAKNLGEVFAEADLCDELLGLAKTPFFAHAQGVSGHLLDRLDVGREPRKAVGGVLLRFDFRRRKPAVDAELFPQVRRRAGENNFGGALGLGCEFVEVQSGSPVYCCGATSRVEGPLAIRISEHEQAAISVDVAERRD